MGQERRPALPVSQLSLALQPCLPRGQTRTHGLNPFTCSSPVDLPVTAAAASICQQPRERRRYDQQSRLAEGCQPTAS